MARFKKKPMFAEAYQVTECLLASVLFDDKPYPKGLRLGSASAHPPSRKINSWHGFVTTIHEQEAKVVMNDWVIDEGDGVHFYPCKPDIFAETYEAV